MLFKQWEFCRVRLTVYKIAPPVRIVQACHDTDNTKSNLGCEIKTFKKITDPSNRRCPLFIFLSAAVNFFYMRKDAFLFSKHSPLFS